MKSEDVGTPVGNFITQVIKDINTGLSATNSELKLDSTYRWILKDHVELELSLISKSQKKGMMDIRVLNFDAGVKQTNVQKLKFTIGPRNLMSKEERIASRQNKVELEKEMIRKNPL